MTRFFVDTCSRAPTDHMAERSFNIVRTLGAAPRTWVQDCWSWLIQTPLHSAVLPSSWQLWSVVSFPYCLVHLPWCSQRLNCFELQPRGPTGAWNLNELGLGDTKSIKMRRLMKNTHLKTCRWTTLRLVVVPRDCPRHQSGHFRVHRPAGQNA